MSKFKAALIGAIAAVVAFVLALLGKRASKPDKTMQDAEKRDTVRVEQAQKLQDEVVKDVAQADQLRAEPVPVTMTEAEAKAKLGGILK